MIYNCFKGYLKSSLSTPNVCMDNSLVGLMMMTPVPFLGKNLTLSINSMDGMRKESVFPLPVLAAPTKSYPSNNWGMVLACMSVMCVKPISEMAFSVLEDTFEDSEEND